MGPLAEATDPTDSETQHTFVDKDILMATKILAFIAPQVRRLEDPTILH